MVRVWLLAALILLPSPGGPGRRSTDPTVTVQAGSTCRVCREPVTSDDLAVLYHGRRVSLHPGACLAAWEEQPERYFAELRPRGALFQEPPRTGPSPHDAWLGLGLYVVLGLIAGATCAYVAVGRGLAALPWFLAGLAVNVVALVVLLTRRPGDLSGLPAGVPRGLAKVATTRSPMRCAACGTDNHPAARECGGCRAALEPRVEAREELVKSPGSWLRDLLASGSGELRRPVVGKGYESSVRGLHVIGDLAGAPVIKLAMEQGVAVIEHIAGLPEMKRRERTPDVVDVLVVGAGAAGLNAALAAADRGLSCVVLEKEKIANTIENFPEGKWVYAEPDAVPPRGKLWLDGARKEELVARWKSIVAENRLDVRTEEPLVSLARRKDGTFRAVTPQGENRARRVVLATGQRGNPRKLGVPGEDQERVYHRLYSPRKYRDESILVVGGGNSAVEAALTLSEANRVVLSYRGDSFRRVFRDNRNLLEQAVAAGRIELLLGSNVTEFRANDARVAVGDGVDSEDRVVPFDHAFVLIGAELPVDFLTSLGIRLENDWTGSPLRSTALTALSLGGLWLAGGQAAAFGWKPGAVGSWLGGLVALACLVGLVVTGVKGDRWSWLGVSFFVWYSIYGIKYGAGEEFWPFRGWGYEALSFFDRPWSFWYTVLYTALMTFFGLEAVKRWGLDRRDRFQIWRFVSLISFQWIFFFIVPEFLFQWAVKYQWVGERLATDPQFAEQAWRSYGIVYAWPLFFYTWFYDPHQIWIVWGVLLTFVVVPVFVLFQGKRYCSWICGCGGLAETFGDRWRHLAPKGPTSIRWEWMNLAVLVFAVIVTALMLGRDTYRLLTAPAEYGMQVYRVLADVWLVGILPVTLYPFLGGKVWCRYWCPLAKMMQIFSKLYTRLGISRFHIHANDKCIACNECSRNCQVGIDVMQYALKQETLDNGTSSCIGCGICVTVCPMDTLSFSPQSDPALPVVSST